MLSRTIIFVVLVSSTFGKRFGSYGRSSSSHSSHTYPSSHGYSGSNVNHGHTSQSNVGHSYPGSTGLSGNKQQQGHQPTNVHQQNTYHSSKTEVHHHYHYNPPPHITYGSQTLPVYHGTPPVYVYEYRNSGSRFDTLLTGLALYNLGKMSAHNHHYDDRRYEGRPGEVCKLGIRKSNGDYEETRINCQLITSFIWEAQTASNHVPKETHTVTSVVNQTVTNINGSVSSVTVTNTNVVDALTVKGPSIDVTPGMTCYLMRISSDSSVMKKTVDCAILQTYAMSSMRNKSERSTQFVEILVISNMVLYYFYVKR